CRPRRRAATPGPAPWPARRTGRKTGAPAPCGAAPARRSPATAARARAAPSAGSPEAQGEMGGDHGRRLVAVEGEARPRVGVEQHEIARRGRVPVPAVALEAERRRRPAHQAGQPARIEIVPRDLLPPVMEPPEPRRLAGGAAAGSDAVELDEVSVDVGLEHRALDPARGERL